MKQCMAILLVLLFCFSIVGCKQKTAVPTYPKAKPGNWYIDEAYLIELEDMSKAEHYLKAMQVPMGKVTFSERLQLHLELYEDDDILVVGVSYAAMRPKNTDREDSQFQRSPESILINEQLEPQVIQIGHDYTYLDYLLIVATKAQIRSLTCGPSVALYVFGAAMIM